MTKKLFITKYKYIFVGSVLGFSIFSLILLGFIKTSEVRIYFPSNNLFQQPAQPSAYESPLFKITCFTKYECPTKICQSGKIKVGEVALNPKHGKDKIVIIDGETYFARWISSPDTDIDIWFENYQECLNFGVQYKQVVINNN